MKFGFWTAVAVIFIAGTVSLAFFGHASAQETTRFLQVTTYQPEFHLSGNIGSATLKGNVLTRSGDQRVGANAWFEWGTSPTLGKTTSSRTIRGGAGGTSQDVNVTIRDLDPDIFYYYRASAQDPFGTAHGDIVRFRLRDGFTTVVRSGGPGLVVAPLGSTSIYPAPKVTTKPAVVIDQRTIIANAHVETGANLSTSGWFEWGPTPEMEFQTPIKQLGANIRMDFSEVLQNLTPNTVYYFRAVVSNMGGNAKGGIFSVATVSAAVGTGTSAPVFPPSSPQTGSPTPSPQPSGSSYAPISAPASDASTGLTVPRVTPPPLFDPLQALRSLFAEGASQEGVDQASSETSAGEHVPDGVVLSDDRVRGQLSLAQVLFGTEPGFFPSTLFGWMLLVTVIVVLFTSFFHMVDKAEHIQEMRKEKQRSWELHNNE